MLHKDTLFIDFTPSVVSEVIVTTSFCIKSSSGLVEIGVITPFLVVLNEATDTFWLGFAVNIVSSAYRVLSLQQQSPSLPLGPVGPVGPAGPMKHIGSQHLHEWSQLQSH